VTVNGAPRAILRDVPTGVIIVDVAPGPNRIEVRWARLPVERQGALISLAAALLLGLLWVLARRLRRA
jgi:hypothetical protein